MRIPWFRLCAVVLLGNVLGYAAWVGARITIPRLWQNQGPSTNFLMLVGLIALSVILIGAPPVLVGALGGWLARRAQALIGLACGLWSITLLGRVPPGFPIAQGLWYAPTILVLLSGALGGWMMDLRATAAKTLVVQK